MPMDGQQISFFSLQRDSHLVNINLLLNVSFGELRKVVLGACLGVRALPQAAD